METRDLYMREIEKMGLVIAKLLGLKLIDKKDELNEEINNAYSELFNLKEDEINIYNEKIINIINSNDASKLFIKKLDALIQLIELDYEKNSISSKKNVLHELIKKLILTDSTTYSSERTNKLNLYK